MSYQGVYPFILEGENPRYHGKSINQYKFIV